jgi:steroid 5-alpha reductase family enzyme
MTGKIESEVTPPYLVGGAVLVFSLGIFAHVGSDTQKFYTLKYKSGLIDEGFFAHSRNMNYLGEVLIYSAFAMLAQHWIPWTVNFIYWGVLFIPSMLTKDKSLSRYPTFAAYKQRSWLFFPKYPFFSQTAARANRKTD